MKRAAGISDPSQEYDPKAQPGFKEIDLPHTIEAIEEELLSRNINI